MCTIEEYKSELSKREIRFGEECTSGNYDDDGNLIAESIPTLTTEYCEIGFYKDSIYFVFIVESSSWSSNFYTAIKSISNVQLYGLKNFTKNYAFGDTIERDIKSDVYFQVQVTFDASATSSSGLLEEYDRIIAIFREYSVQVVNQLEYKTK